MNGSLRERAHAMHELALRYYIDLSDTQIGDVRVKNWNTTLAFLTYMTKGRHLLKGDPSTGKTSLSALVCSILGGVPPDLAKRVLVRGTPDLTREDVTGRLQYGKLHEGKEWVVWNLAHTMPFFNLDELLRIPTKLQSLILTGIEDGIWTYASSYSIDVGKRPGFYTINPRDSGSFELTYALMDRMTASSEHWPLPSVKQDEKDLANVLRDVELSGLLEKEDLPEGLQKLVRDVPSGVARSITEQISRIGEETTPPAEGMSNQRAFQETVKRVTELREKYRREILRPLLGGLEPLDEGDLDAILWEMRDIPFDPDAIKVRFWWEASMNTSGVYGRKRSEDHVSPTQIPDIYPDRNYAVSKVEGPLTNRVQGDANTYARAIAWWMGKESIDVETYRTALVYCMNHRIPFDPLYAASNRWSPRKTDLQTHLSELLLDEMSKDYQQVHGELFDIVGKVVRADFDPTIEEGEKGFDKGRMLTRRQWDLVKEGKHPVVEQIRNHLDSEFGIYVERPWVKEYETLKGGEQED